MEHSSALTPKNRTGLQLSPRRARELFETMQGADFGPLAGNGHALAAARGAYMTEAGPLDTLPAHLVHRWYVLLSLAGSGAD